MALAIWGALALVMVVAIRMALAVGSPGTLDLDLYLPVFASGTASHFPADRVSTGEFQLHCIPPVLPPVGNCETRRVLAVRADDDVEIDRPRIFGDFRDRDYPAADQPDLRFAVESPEFTAEFAILLLGELEPEPEG